MVMVLPAKACSTGCAASGAAPAARYAVAMAVRRVVLSRSMWTFPGRSAARSRALQTPDRSKLEAWNDPGSAAHHQEVLRCAREKYPDLGLRSARTCIVSCCRSHQLGGL